MQHYSFGSNKYIEIKMCDLEPFSKIWSHFIIIICKSVFTFVNAFLKFLDYAKRQRSEISVDVLWLYNIQYILSKCNYIFTYTNICGWNFKHQ